MQPAHKIRVYEMVDDPPPGRWSATCWCAAASMWCPARALEKLTGADLGELFPMPDISNKKFPEAAKLEAPGLHRIMYRVSLDDYQGISEVWNGPHPEDGGELVVEDSIPQGAAPRTWTPSRS